MVENFRESDILHDPKYFYCSKVITALDVQLLEKK